jgi:hypothetical protein
MSDEAAVLQAFSGLTGVGAIFLAYYAYRLTKRQRDDAWFHAFTSLHETFWNDDDLKCRGGDDSGAASTSIPHSSRS